MTKDRSWAEIAAGQGVDAETVAWLQVRAEEAVKIDAETAEVTWLYGRTCDPYGVLDLPEEMQQAGREYWARTPDGDVWVHVSDLPIEIYRALLDRDPKPYELEDLF